MIIKENVDLKKYTTIKIGGIARKMIIPETKMELIEFVERENVKYYIGGGSNLLISDKVFDLVLNLRSFNTEIKSLGKGHYIVGASVRLQNLIMHINKDGYGGIEYLYSVPGLVGGAIVMNAGRGRSFQKSISDYLISVEVLEGNRIQKYDKKDCAFAYRKSIFKNSDIIVLAAEFQFEPVDIRVSMKERDERIQYCRTVQDNSYPNMGSVFCECNFGIMRLFKIIQMGKGNVHFSRKTYNWLLNKGNGTFMEAEWTINKVKKVHDILNKKCELEVIVWK